MHCLSTAELIPERYRASGIAQPLRTGLNNMVTAWEHDEFVLDPSRVTVYIGLTGIDGATFKRAQPDGQVRHSDQQDIPQHCAVHDQHRDDTQLGRLPHRGSGEHRPRYRQPGVRR